MQELYNKLQNYSLEDAIRIEESDRQFLALKKLSSFVENIELYIFLVITNSLICYQLSWKWEDYWEEFSQYFINRKVSRENIIDEMIIFLNNAKYNRRLINIKIKRLEKLRNFLIEFEWKWEYYYNNMIELRDKLSELMNQKKDAKTITFTIKIYSYFVRNFYDFVEYPKEILIPIDSRLTNLFEKYKWNYTDIKKFYKDLSNKLNIPMLHLDWIVWTLYDDLIK